jgi:hypothetical protein
MSESLDRENVLRMGQSFHDAIAHIRLAIVEMKRLLIWANTPSKPDASEDECQQDAAE